MSSWQPLASPAPNVSSVQVETCVVEPATVDPVPFAEAPTAEPCPPVEMPIAEPIVDTEEQIIPTVEEMPTVEDYKYMSYDTLSTMEGETDFEAYAAVLQGNPSKTLLKKFQSFLTTGNFHERDFVAYGEVRRFIVIKYGYLFVYEDVAARSPIYALSLQEYTIKVEDPKSPSSHSYTISPSDENMPQKDFHTVLLHSDPKRVAFQITFAETEGEELIAKFMAAVETIHKSSSSSAKTCTIVNQNMT